MARLSFGRYSFELTHPDKPLFGKDGPTKAGVADYYRSVAGVMLPHLGGRALTLHRFPDGIDREGFYQQQAGNYFPPWFTIAELDKESGTVDHPVAEKAADLAYLARLGTIGIHAWLSKIDAPNLPDRVVFDLDPPSADAFGMVRRAAQGIRERLEAVGLKPFVKTTGSKGLHVVTPIRPGPAFDTVRAFAKGIAEDLAKKHPDDFTLEQRKEKRAGRVYLDTLRNSYGFTIVAPYSIRPLPGAPVSVPLDWDEVTEGGPGPRQWTSQTVADRLRGRDCPWKGLGRHARRLPET